MIIIQEIQFASTTDTRTGTVEAQGTKRQSALPAEQVFELEVRGSKTTNMTNT